MLQLELPHVNVLSKIDLAERFGKLPASLDFYADAQNLEHILNGLADKPSMKRFRKLNLALAEVIEDFGLVSFETLNIQVLILSPLLLLPLLCLLTPLGQGQCAQAPQGDRQG